MPRADQCGLIARRSALVGLLASTVLGACKPTIDSPIERAEFGVLFGGQIQERTEIPFDLDSNRQSLGFLVRLRRPLDHPTTLHWEVSKPGPHSRLSDPLSRRVELYDAPVAAGQTRVSKAVAFEPGDSLGLWNLRVVLGDYVALDRSFLVYDESSRSVRPRELSPVIDAGL